LELFKTASNVLGNATLLLQLQ